MSYVQNQIEDNEINLSFFAAIFGMLICLVLFWVLYGASNSESLSTAEISNIRTIFAIFGPFLAFVFYFLLSKTILDINFKSSEAKDNLVFVFVLSILGIFFAISLNNRSLTLLVTLVTFGVSIETSLIVILSIVTPLIEEFVKFYPVFVMARHIKFSRNREDRYIQDIKEIAFYSVIGGLVFNMLETYVYTWRFGFDQNGLTGDYIWAIISSQIFLRSTNPLHIVASLISGIGIIIAFYNSTDLELNRKNFGSAVPFFIVAVILHGVWNASAIINQSKTDVFGLPKLNYYMYIIMAPILVGLLFYVRSFRINKCDICHQHHNYGIGHNDDFHLERSQLIVDQDVGYKCENCDTTFSSEDCPNCDSVEVYSCKSCDYPVPIYANKCWKCEEPVKIIYETLTVVEEKASNRLSRNFYYLVSTLYIGQVIGLLYFVLSNSSISRLTNQFTLSFIISVAFLVGIYYNLSDRYKPWGRVISNYMTSLILILVSVLFILIASVLFLIEFYLSGLLLFIVVICYLIVGVRLLIVDTVYVRGDNE